MQKCQKSQNFDTVCHTLSYFLEVDSQTFLKWLRNFKVVTSKFKVERPLTSMASKTAWPKFLKIASNQCKSSKYWWEVWILGRGCKTPNVHVQVFSISFLFVNDVLYEILSTYFKNLNQNKPKAEVNALTLQNDDDQ